MAPRIDLNQNPRPQKPALEFHRFKAPLLGAAGGIDLLANKIIQPPNCRKCAAEMVEKSNTLIPGTTSHRVVFVCEKCGIESIMTIRL